MFFHIYICKSMHTYMVPPKTHILLEFTGICGVLLMFRWSNVCTIFGFYFPWKKLRDICKCKLKKYGARMSTKQLKTNACSKPRENQNNKKNRTCWRSFGLGPKLFFGVPREMSFFGFRFFKTKKLDVFFGINSCFKQSKKQKKCLFCFFCFLHGLFLHFF